MTDLFLTPLDVWLFRDGRPFDSGGNHRAESLFPPYPSVTQGAIRSFQLVQQGVNLNDRQAIEAAVGTSSDVLDLRLRGPFVARPENGRLIRYFPQPADAVSTGEKHIRPAAIPVPAPAHVRSSARTDLLGLAESLNKGKSRLWLSETALRNYLRGETVEGLPEDQLFVRENRLAIGMDNPKRAALQGALYEVEYIRPGTSTGLWLHLEGEQYSNWPQNGVLSLGGERRGAYFEAITTASAWPALPNPLPPRFKLYFASPAYFSMGWQPDDWGKFFTEPVTLHAAAVPRYECMGGYDLSRPGSPHKPSRRYVPAGSVYYFSGKNVAIRNNLPQQAVTEEGGEIGFGQILVEGW